MADANHDFEISDLLSHLKRLICDSLETIEDLDQTKIGLCSLKFNKKLSSGDLIVPAFVRTCFGDRSNKEELQEDSEFRRLMQQVVNRILEIQFIKHCEWTTGGHLLLMLNRIIVTRTIVYKIVSSADQFGKSAGENPTSVLSNPSLSLMSNREDQKNINLDQLRTLLVCDHAMELLRSTGSSVASVHYDEPQIRPDQEQTATWQEICELFTVPYSFSANDLWAENELLGKTQELGRILKSGRYARQINRSKLTESDCSCDNQEVNNVQSVDCICGGEFCCENFILDVEAFRLNENNQIIQGKYSIPKVKLSCSVIREAAKLDLAVRKPETVNSDMLLHVTSCRRAFMQQQVGSVWEIASESPLANKQFYFTHGLVTVNNEGEKIKEYFDAMDFLRTREKQLKESYVLKYGDKVKGYGWDMSIRHMAVAAVKLEMLSASPNSELQLNLSETSREFRQATFVLYNCARLCRLFQNFEENVQKGVYPGLPPVKEVDFNLLRDEAEWELVLNFMMAFPLAVKEAVQIDVSKSQKVTIHTNKICCFLFNLSHKLSSYYGRVHILGESRQHLFPTMFARLYLMKAVQQIFVNCLNLLNVNSPNQM